MARISLPASKSTVITTLVAAFALALAGCTRTSGAGISLFITACDTSHASNGIIGLAFVATGPVGASFDFSAEWSRDNSATRTSMTPAPSAALTQAGITGPQSTTNLTIGASGSTSGTFYWFAGADLGFNTAAVAPLVTPFVTPTGPEGALGGTATCDPIQFASALSPVVVGGGSGGGSFSAGATPGAPPGANTGSTGVGRGAQTGTAAPGTGGGGSSGNGLLVTGGRTVVGTTTDGQAPPSAGGAVDAFGTVDRLQFNLTTFEATLNFSGAMGTRRTDMATSFFFDPTNGLAKVLICGGAQASDPTSPSLSSGNLYCLAHNGVPEQVTNLASVMLNARRGHTATWTPGNRVFIVGGETVTQNGTTVLGAIEFFDPTTNTFVGSPIALNFPRRDHTATLLPNGKILIAGGWDPTAAMPTALPAEVIDPGAAGGPAQQLTSLINRVGHSATRLANGNVLIAGGHAVGNPNAVRIDSDVFQPEATTGDGFASAHPMMHHPRALHGASLLGDLHVLISGGESPASGPLLETTTLEIFIPEIMMFSDLSQTMASARAEHSSTVLDGGTVVLLGGRQTDTTQTPNLVTFLGSVEILPFSNTPPSVFTATAATATSMTSAGNIAGHVALNLSIDDADNDGGYLVIRYRTLPGGQFQRASIDSQSPSTAAGNFPNFQVSPGAYSFNWNYAADGLGTGQAVEIEVLPIGAVLGTPYHFSLSIP